MELYHYQVWVFKPYSLANKLLRHCVQKQHYYVLWCFVFFFQKKRNYIFLIWNCIYTVFTSMTLHNLYGFQPFNWRSLILVSNNTCNCLCIWSGCINIRNIVITAKHNVCEFQISSNLFYNDWQRNRSLLPIIRHPVILTLRLDFTNSLLFMNYIT